MNTYRKSLIIQLIMFVVFLVMAINVTVQHYVLEQFPAYSYIVLGVLVLFGVAGFLFYKKASNEMAVITPKELKTLKTLLYVYLFLYIGEMLLSGIDNMPKDIIAIGFGSLLSIVAITGIVIQYQILKHK